MKLTGIPLLLLPAILAATELSEDLAARRAKLMTALGPPTVLIIQSAPERVYSRDVEYEYRQDSDFYYLTGIDQPNATLILMPGNSSQREILFIEPANPAREHREGRRLTPGQATEASAVANVYSNVQLNSFLESVLDGRPFMPVPTAERPADFDVFLQAVDAGDAKLAIVLNRTASIEGPVSPTLAFANRLRDRFPGLRLRNVAPLVHALRQVKTPYERKILTQSVDISVKAQLAGMRAARPGAHEYAVKAAIEQVFRDSGASGWGYPSITGSGPNATILHYAAANRRMDAGDLMLVDAAANYRFYTGDITRTYPAGGKYTEPQKEIYRIVIEAQEEAIRVVKPGAMVRDVHQKTVDVIKAGLLRLGLITDAKGDQYRTWYTHGSVHYIGIDVHDVGDRFTPLAPGHAFVIEPGIYIREDGLASLEKTPENLAMIDKVKPAFERFRGIGIRLEDSFLLTETGLINLSAKVPRTIDEIETFLRPTAR